MQQKKVAQSKKEPPEPRDIKEFILRETALSKISGRNRATLFFFASYGLALITTFTIIFLQGFHVWGFTLDATFLNWLGAATIGELGGLALLVYGFYFRS